MRVLRRPSGPVNPKVESAVGITLTRGLRANGEIKLKRGIVHLAHWNAHGREWADLLAQRNDQSSYDERILTEVTILFPTFQQCTANFALRCSPRTASRAKEKARRFPSGPLHQDSQVCPTLIVPLPPAASADMMMLYVTFLFVPWPKIVAEDELAATTTGDTTGCPFW